MKLQILVPYHDEPVSMIKNLLDSIAIQVKVDFSEIGVIIVSDGHFDAFDRFCEWTDLTNAYPFFIEIYEKSHEGVSAARNFALDHATAEYIMFADADDMFYKVNGLWTIVREINKGFDAMISQFYEEWKHPDTGEFFFVEHKADSVFVHGKVYRLQYLKENGIQWNNALTIHEDSYFNTLATNLSTNCKYLQNGFWLWRYNENSVCRHDKKYLLKTYINMIDSNEALIEEFLRREMEDKASFYSSLMILEAYYNMNKADWINEDNAEYRNATEKRLSEYFHKYEFLWNKCPEPERMKISEALRARNIKEGMLFESIGFPEWLQHIKSLAE